MLSFNKVISSNKCSTKFFNLDVKLDILKTSKTYITKCDILRQVHKYWHILIRKYWEIKHISLNKNLLKLYYNSKA